MAFSDWDRLLGGIDEDECILFVGPDLPLLQEGGAPRNPALELGERLRQRLQREEPEAELPEAQHLARLAQCFLARDDALELEREVARWNEELQPVESELHAALAQIPFSRIVTTSLDPLLEGALERSGRKPEVAHYRQKRIDRVLPGDPSIRTPLLYHLYGNVSDTSSLVLAETQLLDLLLALSAREPPLPHDVDAALAECRMFLFLGFGLQHWYLRVLLHALKVLRRTRSFALESAQATGGDLDDAVLFYEENFRIQLYRQDVAAFVRELRTRAEDAGLSPIPKQEDVREPARLEAPARVFICHANSEADNAAARRIAEALEGANIPPWFDKESLRGGDLWDDEIERVLEQVDWCVVVHSQALRDKLAAGGSYVSKEVSLALDRSHYYTRRAFIVPVRIDDSELAQEFRDFQWIDLQHDAETTELIRSLKRNERR